MHRLLSMNWEGRKSLTYLIHCAGVGFSGASCFRMISPCTFALGRLATDSGFFAHADKYHLCDAASDPAG